MHRVLPTALVAAALFLGTAAHADSSAPLNPGKPAGVGTAQSETSTAVLVGLGAGLTGLAIALIASNGKAGGVASTTTSVSTSTNP